MKEKLFKNIEMKRPARRDAARGAGVAAPLGRRGWRFAGRVLSLVLTLSLLFNSVSFGMDDAAYHSARAAMEGLTLDSGDYVPVERETEIGGDTGAAYDAGQPGITYGYIFETEKTVLLSQIFAMYALSVPMQSVETVMFIGGGDLDDPTRLVQVEPLRDAQQKIYDYQISALQYFSEVRLSVPIAPTGAAYILVLSNPILAVDGDAEVAEAEAFDLDDDDAPADIANAAFAFSMEGSAQVRLSDIIHACGMPFAAGEVEMVALAGGGDRLGAPVLIEDVGGDYLITAQEDFGDARLLVYTAQETCELLLTNGREAGPGLADGQDGAEVFLPEPVDEEVPEEVALDLDDIAEETTTEPVGETPAEPVGETTTEPVEETATEPTEATPDEPAGELTSTPVEETPAESVEELPEEPVEEQPAEPVEEQPAEPVEEQPAEPVEEQPAEPVVEAPQTEPGQELPVEPVDDQPIEPEQGLPVEPADDQPTEPTEEQPTEPVEEQPTEPVEEQPTEPVEEQPTEPVDEQPTEPVEEQPTEPVEEQPTEPVEEPPAYPAQTFAGGTARVRVCVDAPEGAFPEGTTMSVTPNEDGGVLSGIADAVAEDHVEIKAIYAVDIDFHDAAGEEIEPLLPTAVVMSVDAITESQRALIVHVNGSGVAEIVGQTDAPQTRDGALSLSLELPGAARPDGQPLAAEPSVVAQSIEAQSAVVQSEAAGSVAEQPDEAQYEEEEIEIVPEQVDAVVRETETDLAFEADAFSTYAVVITEPIPARTLDAVGDSWAVGLTCGADAGIPADAALEVTEMTGAVAEVFTEQAARVLDVDVDSFTYVKVLDMAIVKDGESLQPQAPVDVSVQLYDMPERPAAEDELRVVHFSAIPQALDCAVDGNTVTFEADGFSAYVIALRSERQFPAQSFTDRTAGVTVSVDAPEGAFPEGTTMQARRVMDRDTISDIREAVAEDFVEVRRVQIVDITFRDADGREIEPRLPVSVVMTVTGMKSEQEAMVVHVDDAGAVNVQSSEVQDPQSRNMEVAFDAGTFSMYAVVVTEVIETRYIDADGNTWSVEVGYGPEAGIPSGATLSVSELTGAEADAYAARAAEALDLEADALAYAKALDIAIVSDGERVQPLTPVSVSVRLLDAPEDLDEVNVLHFGSEVETVDCALNGDTVDFETDGFSVYVVVCTTLRQTLTASDGNEYLVTVTYDHASGIPSDAELSVSEIKEGEAGYEEYVAQSAAALGEKAENLAFARPFDITLKNPQTGEEYQPNEAVQVSIQLLKDNLDNYANVDVVHIPGGDGEEAQVMDATVHGEAVEFETDGFSVYVLCGYGPDFSFGDYTYNMKGELLLSALLEQLGVTEIALSDVTDVSFTDPEVLEIVKAEGDWLLRPLAPFNGPEALTLALVNGQSVEIGIANPYPAQFFTGRVSGVSIVVEAPEGAFPQGVTMKAKRVWNNDTLSEIREAMTEDYVRVHRVQAVDIAFFDASGAEIEPRLPISVVMSVSGMDPEQNAMVVHVDDAGEMDVQDAEVKDPLSGTMALSFDADSFSLYAVVVTETISTHYIDAFGNTYEVEVSYGPEAGIPSGAKLAVSELEGDEAEAYAARAAEALGADAGNLSYVKALDISIVADGDKVQPKIPVSVSIKLLDAPEAMDKNSINVVHFGDRPEPVSCALNGETVEFEADGFSVYVFLSNDGTIVTPQCTYTFWVPSQDAEGYAEYALVNDQGKTVHAQTITSGEELIVPQMPSTEDSVFAGWYEGYIENGRVEFTVKPGELEPEPYDFDDITITENSAIDLYAVYKAYATVTFHDQYDSETDSFPVAYTRRAELTGEAGSKSAQVKITDLDLANTSVGDVEMGFLGWSTTPVQTPGIYEDEEHNPYVIDTSLTDGCITITGNEDLYPIFKAHNLLTFYAAPSGQGAAYNGPRYLFEGESLDYLPTSSLAGYTFLGWWTGSLKEDVSNPKPGEDVQYGSQISDANGYLIVGADDAGVYVSDNKFYMRADATLFAKWEVVDTAEYKIIYWKQLGIGSDYVFAESKSNTGTVGSTVSVADEDKKEDRYEGYRLKENPAEAEVKADGSTVLNVYYDHDSSYMPSSGIFDLKFMDSVTEAGKISENLPQTHQVEAGASLADHAIENPVSGRKGYEFDQWYLDPSCTNAANLSDMTMPDQALTLYAGWKVEWYFVSIDPNYGELRPLNEQGVPTGSGSTWFWQTIEREPISEYSYVERNYVESSAGTYYYVGHLGNGVDGSDWPDRYTYYTTDPGKATEDTTFEYSPGTYTYAGWYELHEDGSETPYVFGEKTDHNTSLRLHWKKNGVYYLAYDAVDGTLEDGTTKEVVLTEGYADYSEIVVDRAAVQEDYTFVGWKVRGSADNTIYKNGQAFTLHAEDAQRVGGKDIVYLDAVYAKVGTASITYDANRGTIADSGVNFGKVPGSESGTWVDAQGSIDTDAGTATVSGVTNNSKIILSNGAGFTAPEDAGTSFLGWSDKPVCDDAATFYDKDSAETYAVNTREPRTLYAVWGVQVTYNHGADAGWGDTAWDSEVYTLDRETDTYSQTVKVGNAVTEPANIPVYQGTDGRLFRYWATRTGTGSDADPYAFTEYDFSQPVTGALDLYAVWTEPNIISVHAVDASAAMLIDRNGQAGWTVNDVTVSTAETVLDGASHVTAPADYEFAFAALASSLDSVSESNAVTAIKYEDKAVKVKYRGESDFRVLSDSRALYFVYYQKKALAIGYKSMEASGVLADVAPTADAPKTTGDVLLGEYDMSTGIPAPLTLATGFTNYAFAIGSVDPGDGTQMNASNLCVITDAADAAAQVPTLRIRNTWRGFEYTTQAGDDAEWTDCGYDLQLYVIYYTQTPTVVLFHERTVGTSTVVDATSFTLDLLVTQATTTTNSVQTQIKDGSGNWVDSGDPVVETFTSDPITIFDTKADGNQPYILKDAEGNSAILFYSSSTQTGEPELVDENARTITTTTEITAQTAVITQTVNNAFTTHIKADGADEVEGLVYTYTTAGTGGTENVTFTNTHKSLPVEVHVAMVEHDGTEGGIFQRDTAYRSQTEANYRFDLGLGQTGVLLDLLPQASVFSDDTGVYAFGAVMYGTGSEGSAITVRNLGVSSVSYAQIDDNVYELVLKDSEGKTLGELGSDQIYYLYYPMARIRYVKMADDGSLEDITGCALNPETGAIEPSEAVTYGHNTLTMNGKQVEQNQSLEIPLSGLVISQSGNHFRMPPVLDDGLSERYLSYVQLGAGNSDAASISGLDTTLALAMQIKVQDNTLRYSFDGSTWKDLPIEGTPTVYAIYTERGYDFQISKAVDTSQSGKNAIFTNSSFDVTISSAAITKNSYEAIGAEGATVSAIPASEGVPGRISLTVVDGTRIRIKGLGRGDYTVTESGNENYTLTAKLGPIVGGASSDVKVDDNTTITFALDTEKKLDLTNNPKAICKIGDHYFYTLRSMVEYVDAEITSKTAEVEMLTDYVMPKADTVEIPGDFNLTIATAEEGFSGSGVLAVITRTNDLADVAPFTTSGSVTFRNIVLDGGSVDATMPVISSAGDLTIGAGAEIRNAINNSTGDRAVYGGAIHATAGNISVSGAIRNCSAKNGGAIYYTGNGMISLSDQGTIMANTATAGDGGAIYMAGGSLKLSGISAITGNNAESGRGGAVYADGTVEIEIDQGGIITGNSAQQGGAIYANATGTIIITETENVTVKPSVTGNIATSGNGGAIYVDNGSVSISGGSLSDNKAENGQGGAVYTNTASVTVSGTAEVRSNTAKEGGAVYAGSGNVTVSGGSLSENTADTDGGAVYAGSGTVTLLAAEGQTAQSIRNNTAKGGKGGAIYADAGAVSVTGFALVQNTAGSDGGAIYARKGAVTLTNATLGGENSEDGNTAGGRGGAVYAGSGNVTVSGGGMSNNTAVTDGGAVYAGEGMVTLSVPEGETAQPIRNNTATEGKGGAIYADAGAVSVTGSALVQNSAGSEGGAIYANKGAVALTNVALGGENSGDGNTAGSSGGAVYADSGNVTVSGGSIQNNKSTTGNGGAIYLGSGSSMMSETSLNSNSAEQGKGGAIYLDSGSLTLTSATAEHNRAINGAAVFTNTGRASFNDGSYTNNVASEGGAVGVGSTNARLVLNGNVQIKDNTLGTADDALKSNVYLDQDDDAVINIDTLGTNASIGIYVANSVENTRGVPGARFAVFTNSANVAKITNDRYTSLTIQSDTAAKKLFWGNSIKVSVYSLDAYDKTFTQPASGGTGTEKKKIDYYYPEFSDASISELASELVTKSTIDIGTNLYAGAYLDGERSFEEYITKLTWHSDVSEWYVTTRSGGEICLKKTDNTGYHRIYIYYAQPAYISIENNTDMALTITDMKVNDTSVVNSDTVAGYGMVFARNGAIRTSLLPVAALDLNLAAGDSINLLIPGGRNKTYTLVGQFNGTKADVRLRRTGKNEEALSVTANVPFDALTGTTLNSSGTYQIIFGNDKNICKVVDASGTEHPYSKISDAITAIKNSTITLETDKTATIEMLTDYLLPASDHVLIPRGYDITLTSAAPAGTEGVTYPYRGESADGRAVISRDSENKYSMLDAWNSAWNPATGKGTDNVSAMDGTYLRLNKLVFDGKSVRGESDGGAVASKYVKVYVNKVDFKNVYASNGGAMLIMFSAKDKNNKATVPGTVMEVRNSRFIGCTSWTTEKSNRLGGGAIVTNAETMTLENCDFSNCTAVDQAGAVFHRVDGNYNSWTEVTGCTFTNCSADAAGGLELDSKNINVTNCRFEHCVAKARNGGGFNVWPLNSGTPSADCRVTLTGCSFLDCQALTQNGGGFRSAAVYTTVNDCTFTNTSGAQGGGIAMSNTNAKEGKVYGCTFDRCTASNQGGGFYCVAIKVEIGDYTYPVGQAPTTAGAGSYIRDENGNIIGRHTEIKNCTSSNEGGGVYHARNDNKSSLTVENATVSGNQIRNSSKNGGGIYTNARKVVIEGSTITDNKCTNLGGGVYANPQGVYSNNADMDFHNKIRMIVSDSTISRNIASSSGSGVWFDTNNDDNNRAKQILNIEGSAIDGNTSGNQGGGIYTLAKIVTIGASETKTDSNGKAIRSSISNNTAKSGGGIYQSRNVEGSKLEIRNASVNDNRATNGSGGGINACVQEVSLSDSEVSKNTASSNGGGIYQNLNIDGSKLEICNASINGNTANNAKNETNAGGGGIFAGVRTLTITNSTVSDNTSKIHGGGILFEINDDNARNAMCLYVEGCTLNGNTASGNGGGIYTKAKTVEIKAHTEGTGESAVVTKSEISNCTATWSGGGIYDNRGDVDGSDLKISNTTVSGCVSNDTSTDGNPPRGGGGIFANVHTVTVTGSNISNNKAARNGGGIDAPMNGDGFALILDDTTITGNSAAYQGGGAYTRSHLTLRSGTQVTGNRLTTNTPANCAGIYLPDGRTLFVGPEDAKNGQSDTVIVRDNTTANGTLSDLRLWDKGSENHDSSVYVYCDLTSDSEIRVVNAAKVGTQFGTSKFANPAGFSDDAPVFKADASTLHGIIDRIDDSGQKIIWAGPPIAKITDGEGNLLYLKQGTDGSGNTVGTSPAIFDKLGTGKLNDVFDGYSTVAAFNMLCEDSPELYTADGNLYQGSSYCIKMLDDFETAADLNVKYVEGRTITFTTASRRESDGYSFHGSGTRATVVRGAGVNTGRTLLNAKGNLVLENIVIDGGSENGITAGSSTRCMYIDHASCTVTLADKALLQNGRVSGSDGGGVYLNSGTFNIDGGVIRNCTCTKDGGGVYQANGSFKLEAGSIYQCSVDGSGGGLRIKSGSFSMTGGTIQGCSANNGGGVYVAGGKTMSMSGGSIINNSAKAVGGGIAVWNTDSRIYFSGKVTVSGNKATKDGKQVACNVELDKMDKNTKYVIQTNNGGLFPGSYIGVYVTGTRDDDNPGKNTDPYKSHGVERSPFGTFAEGDNTTNLYGFVNDRNGFKGGIIENPEPYTIYWIKIFSLEVGNTVVSGDSTVVDPNEPFLFKVNIRGEATVSGQSDAKDIEGTYGDMVFTSNKKDTTTAVFALKDGESVTGVNLSEGLRYEIIQYLIVSGGGYDNQHTRYAAMPMNGNSDTQERLTYNGTTYTVIKANSYSSKIGENKSRTDVDPYTSAVPFTNLMPVCKVTDSNGGLLYQKYSWKKTTNKPGEQAVYNAPAVYTELTGDNGAFKALDGTLYTSNGSNPTSYSTIDNAVKIQMLIGEYGLREAISVNKGIVTLTTASATDALFPKQDAGTTSTVKRAFEDASMLTVSSDLTLDTIILDGAKNVYTVETDGGIANVREKGKLTIQTGATLQNSKTTRDGGAVYAASGATVTMTAGTINKNESDGNGAGIYLAENSAMNLSGKPSFGGKGIDVGGNISVTNGNWKNETLTGMLNGDKPYPKPRQDIFITGYENEAASALVVTDEITSGDGTIWVWAEEALHSQSNKQFAKIVDGHTVSVSTLKAFRNARDDDSASNDTGNYLYGITKDGRNILWNGKPVCKLTGSNDALLYERVAMSGNRYVYNPAVYATVAEGFGATNNTLYYRANGSYRPFEGGLKLKMLQDYTLGSGETNITYETKRELTYTTAENNKNASTLADGDIYIYTPAEGATGDRRTKATLTKDQSTASMFTVYTPNSFTVSNLILDGNKDSITSESVNGGIINVTTGKLIVADGAVLRNSVTTGDGGAVYVAANATVEMTGGEITGNEAVNGGAVYVKANATMTLKDGKDASNADTHGTINGNTATANGAGIYLDYDDTTKNGAKLKLQGRMSFGGTGRKSDDVDAEIITEKTEDGKTVVVGNFVEDENALPDDAQNGQKEYGKLRQDIYVAGYQGVRTGTTEPLPATSIVVTGKIDSGDGSIWVAAEKPGTSAAEAIRENNHYEMLKQFAVFADGVAYDETTVQAFRNAWDDESTGCGADYLTGQDGDDLKDDANKTWKCIYWTGGFDFVFRKVDGDGKALDGAKFTLFMAVEDPANSGKFVPAMKNAAGKYVPATSTDEATWAAYEQTDKEKGGKKDATAESKNIAQSGAVKVKYTADGGANVDDVSVCGKGLAVFEKIPPGVYFMVEKVRTKKAGGGYDIATGAPLVEGKAVNYQSVEEMYRVVIDGKGYYTIQVAKRNATTGQPEWDAAVKSGKVYTWPNAKNAPTVKLTETANNSKVFTDEGKGTATIDLFTAMNVSPLQRKVILKKVDGADYKPLGDANTVSATPTAKQAQFTVYYADKQTVVKVKNGTDAFGKDTYETLENLLSGVSGAFWIGKLPYGTYYLHETSVPSGYRKLTDTNDNWFILTVNENGVGYETEDYSIINRLSPETTAP